jgi:hypothetical protein
MTIEIKQYNIIKIFNIAILLIALFFILSNTSTYAPVIKFNYQDSVMENHYPNFKK